MTRTLLLLSGTLFIAASVFAEDYAINMQIPFKVNERYAFKATAEESSGNIVTSDDKVTRNVKKEFKVEMESTMTVLAVDDTGRMTKSVRVISKLVSTKDGVAEVVLPAGTKVTAFEKDKEHVFEIDNEPVAKDKSAVLKLVAAVSHGGSPEQELFGANERKKAGDSWSINEALMLKDLQSGAPSINVKKVTGKTTLQKVTKEKDADVLHLVVSAAAEANPDMGPSFSADLAQMQVTITGTYPADPLKRIPREEARTMISILKASGDRAGEKVRLDSNNKSVKKRTYSPLN